MKYSRPSSDEYPPYYASYVARVSEGDLRQIMEEQVVDYGTTLGGLSAEQALFQYAPGKWTVKEVLGHVIDSERVFAYRAMRFARRDETALPGYDENHFVANAGFNDLAVGDLLKEFAHLRRSNILLFDSFRDEVGSASGLANGLPVTVRALVYINAGHAAHHLAILKEKYL